MLFQKLAILPALFAALASAGLVRPLAKDSVAKRDPTSVRVARNQFNPRKEISRTRVRRQGGASVVSCPGGQVNNGLNVCVELCTRGTGYIQNLAAAGGCLCASGYLSLGGGAPNAQCILQCTRGTGYQQDPSGGCQCSAGFTDVGLGVCQRTCTSPNGVQSPTGGCICNLGYTSLDGGVTCIVLCTRGTGYTQNPAGGCSCATGYVDTLGNGVCQVQCPAGSGGTQNPAGGCNCPSGQVLSSLLNICVNACLSTNGGTQNPNGGCTCPSNLQVSLNGLLCVGLNVNLCTRSAPFTQTLLPNVPGCIGTVGSVCGASGSDVTCPLLSTCARVGITNNFTCQTLV